MQSVISKFKSFHRNEDGVATVWAMFWLIICFALSGLAIDTANAWRIKQILQSTADASSVSAAMEFYFTNPEDNLEERVKLVANTYADANMNQNRYGDVLPNESIFLGYWDGSTFNPDLNNGAIFPNAVRVITEQVDEFSLGTYFLRFISIFDFDVRASSVAAYHLAACEGAAILSTGNVMIEGQNAFNHFCIFGEQGVDVQASNFFDIGSAVGMPDLEDCGSGNSRDAHCSLDSMATSDGFAEALFQGDAPKSMNFKLNAATGFFGGLDGLSDAISIYGDEFKEYTKAVDAGETEAAAALKDSFDAAAIEISGELSGFTNDYLYESMFGPIPVDRDDQYYENLKNSRDASQTTYLTNDVVILDMALFIDAEREETDTTDGVETVVKASSSIPLFDVIDELYPSPSSSVDNISSTTSYSGTTYIVDCTRLDQTRNYKMDMGGSNLSRTISNIAIVGLGCDYKFDTSINYDSSFIVTTSTAGLKGNGRASISSSAGAYLGNENQSCDGDKLTLLTQGSMKFGSQLKGSNFDFVVAGTVNIASGSNSDPEPHVGSSITALNDVHISSHHTFNGCGGPWEIAEGDLGNRKFRVSIVQ